MLLSDTTALQVFEALQMVDNLPYGASLSDEQWFLVFNAEGALWSAMSDQGMDVSLLRKKETA